MTGRDHRLLAALAGAGALLTLFQVWYISLPMADALAFDICRLSPVINCYRSLHVQGDGLIVLGVLVFPALCALFWLMFALCAFAWVAVPGRREAWLGLARLLSFPAAGLAIFVLLNDLTTAKATSISGIGVALIALAIAVSTVMQGLAAAILRRAGWPATGLAAAALLLAFFLQGAMSARRGADIVLLQRGEEAPGVLWPRFARNLERRGAAHLGKWTAPKEVLLFVDPRDEASRAVMREAAEVMPEYADKLLLTIYARSKAGAELVLAQREGSLARHLTSGEPPKASIDSAQAVVAEQEAAWPKSVQTLPAVVGAGRAESGRFDLRAFLDRASVPR